MDLNLQGDTAIVTASSSGLGKASATVLVEEGTNVVVNGRNTDRLEAAAAEIRETATGSVVAVPGDITESSTWESLVEAALAEFGGIDHLVTSAGGIGRDHFVDTTIQEWRDAVDLLLLSVAGVVQEAVDHLRADGGGTITTITSTYSKEAVPTYVFSNSVRMSVLGLTKTLSRELGPGIRANSVLPGWHATPLTLGPVEEGIESGKYESMEEGIRDRLSDYDIPLDRMGDPRELGNVVAFMCSDRASYVTGTAVPVDGGKTYSNL